jgi:hypothetical protein
VPLGIPHSEFCGREREPGEARWLAEDMELALAWHREQQQICPGCAQPWDEATNPANARQYHAHEKVCYGCAVIEWRRNALTDTKADLAGLRLYVTRD